MNRKNKLTIFSKGLNMYLVSIIMHFFILIIESLFFYFTHCKLIFFNFVSCIFIYL